MWQTFFQWISRVCQIKNIKYIQQNLIYYETLVQLLYLSGNHLSLLMIYKNKMVTLKNLILKYIGMKNITILKRKCVFRSVIETVGCMFHEKHFPCPMNMFAQFWPLHNYYVTRKCQEGKQDMFTLWSFYILLYFVEFCIIFSSSWK